MTKETLSLPQVRVLRFPLPIFNTANPNFNKLVSFFTNVINDGYEPNKKKFNVICSTRIKNSDVFMSDLGLYKPESFLIMVVKTVDGDIDLKSILSGAELPVEDVPLDFDPTVDVKRENVLGTIGGKLYDGKDAPGEQGWEITGFTSFWPGVGSYMINLITKLAKEVKKDFLFASVIYEHGLVDYYGRFGFVECSQKLLQQVDPETGRVIGGDLEDGIYAFRDFHVGFLKKSLK